MRARGFGNGTIEVYNGTEVNSSAMLKSFTFNVNRAEYIWSGGDDTIYDYRGGYEFLIEYGDFEPSGYANLKNNYTVRVIYTNGLPEDGSISTSNWNTVLLHEQ